ncbi:hypothetical protein [Brevibacillus brevis]|uniref:hypothetical protein n=1 Tax=Brevibacillus brevis TaxID=1393 RepID=UPI0007D89E4D|nr:hypothetical protein [Brevibacillus brevis]
MSILSWDKPKKLRNTEEHNKLHSSDCGVAGTFVPNMSDEDNRKWKAKHVKGEDERVEIRKEFINYKSWSQVLITVRNDGVVISMNGKTGMNNDTYDEFKQAIEEARQVLIKG